MELRKIEKQRKLHFTYGLIYEPKIKEQKKKDLYHLFFVLDTNMRLNGEHILTVISHLSLNA